tara:strand:- start:182 stop:1054 length:873 start_codon:yes stop_codon:yes gene_type:complete
MFFEYNFYDGVSFYETFTPIKKEVEVPLNLLPFAEQMSEHHSLDLVISTTEPIKSSEQYEMDNNKCIVLFSSGIDSTWSLIYALENGLTPYPVYIEGLNSSVSSREKKSCLEIVDKLGLNLITFKHQSNLKKLHRNEDNIIKIPESLAKLQYALMLCKQLFIEERIGQVLVTVDEDSAIFNNPTSQLDENQEEIEWFSDAPESMETFLPFLSDYVGGDIEGLYPKVAKGEKIKLLIDKGLFELTTSCILNPMFFIGHRKKNHAPKEYMNMCGVCWKCKENLKFLAELGVI